MVSVRPARPGDGEALVGLHAEMAEYYLALDPDYFRPPALSGFASEIDGHLHEPPNDELRLVAEDEGELAGCLVALLLRPAADSNREITSDLVRTRLRIEYLATAETHRRQGVASLLIEAAERWGRDRGATVAEASTFQASPLSMPFWTRRSGYTVHSVHLRKPI